MCRKPWPKLGWSADPVGGTVGPKRRHVLQLSLWVRVQGDGEFGEAAQDESVAVVPVQF
jgi:hypothetical protein